MSEQQNGGALPERDMSLPSQLQGEFRKYDVRRVDGRDQPGGDREGDQYFVLNLTRDPHSVNAMGAYARSCEVEFPFLAADVVRGLLDRNGGAFDTLVQMVLHGPRESGQVPSKSGRTTLLDAGLAAQVVAANGEWVCAATPAGVKAFVDYYGGANLAEAKANYYAANSSLAAHAHSIVEPVGAFTHGIVPVNAHGVSFSPEPPQPCPCGDMHYMPAGHSHHMPAPVGDATHPPVDTLSLAEGVPRATEEGQS